MRAYYRIKETNLYRGTDTKQINYTGTITVTGHKDFVEYVCKLMMKVMDSKVIAKCI